MFEETHTDKKYPKSTKYTETQSNYYIIINPNYNIYKKQIQRGIR